MRKSQRLGRFGAERYPALARIHRLEVTEPALHDLAQALPVEPIEAAAALAADLYEASPLEDAEVSRGGGPAVLKTRGEIARGKLVAKVTQNQNDVAARLVRQRGKHGFNIGERELDHATLLISTQGKY